MYQDPFTTAAGIGVEGKRAVSDSPGDTMAERRFSVGILIDLALTPTSGGHVRFWHNIAKAAAKHGCEFDLTFHFQSHFQSHLQGHLPNPSSSRPEAQLEGDLRRSGRRAGRERVTRLSEHVRIVELPPVLSTARIKYLAQSPDHTDLSPYHRRIGRHLESYDVIHTTDAYFAYAKTASRLVDRTRQALVTSIHTDTPAYTRVYSERAFRNFFGTGRLASRVIDDWDWPGLAESRMQKALVRHLRSCEHIWFAPADDPEKFGEFTTASEFDVLRRGLDWQIFSPDRRDRERLEREFDLDDDDFVLVFAGRIDVGKEVMVAARATRRLIDRGLKVKLILAGLGSDTEAIRELLGPAVRLPGFVDQERLGSILASSDAFVFPSRIETAANAVIEARAVGLPVFASPRIADMLIREDGVDGVVVETQTSEAWANAIERLIRDPDLAKKMGAMASAVAAQTQPSWHDVLIHDLVPGWRRARRDSASPGTNSGATPG
jgi:glycosyltransferase involved in cell wall biosynthesis